MPTILYVQRWRFHFYPNEGNEPMQPDSFDIVEEFEYNCTPRLRREVRQIIFAHFEQIIDAWRGNYILTRPNYARLKMARGGRSRP